MAWVLPCFPGIHTHTYTPLSIRAWVPTLVWDLSGPLPQATGILWLYSYSKALCACILFVPPYPRNAVSFLALPDSCARSQPDSMLLVPCGDTFCLLSEGWRLAAGSSCFTIQALPQTQSRDLIERLLVLPALLCTHPAAPGPAGM